MKIRYIIALLLAVLANVANAQISVGSFKVLDQYLQDGKLLIKNATPSTEIKIEVVFAARLNNQGYANPANIKIRMATGNASGQPIYLSSQETITNADFPRYTGSITKSFTINIDKSKLTSGIVISLLTEPNGQAEGSFTGKYYHYVLETPVVSPIIKASIYLASMKYGGVNDMFQLFSNSLPPSGWHSYGVSFRAYINPNSVSEFGTTQVYEFRYNVVDQNGVVGDPGIVYFYSTSQTFSPPPAPTGYTYQFDARTNFKLYAFSTQIPNTIPILECRHKTIPVVLYKPGNTEISDMYDTSVAFYAYNWNEQ